MNNSQCGREKNFFPRAQPSQFGAPQQAEQPQMYQLHEWIIVKSRKREAVNRCPDVTCSDEALRAALTSAHTYAVEECQHFTRALAHFLDMHVMLLWQNDGM